MMFVLYSSLLCSISTLSLHDALPISRGHGHARQLVGAIVVLVAGVPANVLEPGPGRAAREDSTQVGHQLGVLLRSEEHTSELQSPCNLVCRLLLENIKSSVLVINLKE